MHAWLTSCLHWPFAIVQQPSLPCPALLLALPCSYSSSGCAAGVPGFRLVLAAVPRYRFFRWSTFIFIIRIRMIRWWNGSVQGWQPAAPPQPC